MLRRLVTPIGVFAFATAVALAAGNPVNAQGRGGGSGHSGGASHGGPPHAGGGGSHPSTGGVSHGGYYPGVRPGGSYYGSGARYGYGNGFALGIGIGLGYGGLGYGGLGYGGLGYGGLGYGGLSYGGIYSYPSASVASPYYVPYYVPVPGGPDPAAGEPMPPSNAQVLPNPTLSPALGAARITLQVPANAKLWVDDSPTVQAGASREFVTPASLERGKTYRYTFRAQWDENGQPVTRERTVEFQAGGAVIVNFMAGNNI